VSRSSRCSSVRSKSIRAPKRPWSGCSSGSRGRRHRSRRHARRGSSGRPVAIPGPVRLVAEHRQFLRPIRHPSGPPTSHRQPRSCLQQLGALDLEHRGQRIGLAVVALVMGGNTRICVISSAFMLVRAATRWRKPVLDQRLAVRPISRAALASEFELALRLPRRAIPVALMTSRNIRDIPAAVLLARRARHRHPHIFEKNLVQMVAPSSR